MRPPHTCLLTIVCHGHQIQAPLLAWLTCIRHSRRLQGSLSPHAVNFTLCSDHVTAGLVPSSPVIPHAASFRRLAAAAKVVQRLIRAALWRRKKKKAAIAIQVNKHTLYRSKSSADFQPVHVPHNNKQRIYRGMHVRWIRPMYKVTSSIIAMYRRWRLRMAVYAVMKALRLLQR